MGAVRDARPRRLSALAAALLALAPAACGSKPEAGEEPTRFERALATVSAAEPVGVGFGWIDVERLRASGAPLAGELEWAAGALGPGARDLAEDTRAVARSGVDPRAADQLLATATSYTLALRLDGADPKAAAAAFRRAGAREHSEGEWAEFDLGPEWAIPDDRRLEPLGSLGARPAVRPGAVLLARSELARAAMERSHPPALGADGVGAAADCLGDVIAARIVLNNHTHLPNSGPDLLAFGVRPDEREVLCAVGDPGRVATATEALRGAFAAGARDGVSDEPMDELVASARIEAVATGDPAVTRVELERAGGTEPGFTFGAFDRGSMLTYMGMQPPPSPGGSG